MTVLLIFPLAAATSSPSKGDGLHLERMEDVQCGSVGAGRRVD